MSPSRGHVDRDRDALPHGRERREFAPDTLAWDDCSSVGTGTRPDTAEASVAVVDACQGRGLGGMLLERLVQRALEEGVRRFPAVLLTRNRAMRHLFERAGAVRVTCRSGDSLELEVELPLETEAPRQALRAAAGGEVHGQPPGHSRSRR
ncbi:MAG TPA: GNAT family N-acetyltransferase [Thermoleophilaceae bacterium]